MNKLITFEGIDGSGKSTQINLLKTGFDENNINNIIVREPGGNVVSEKIREILLDPQNFSLSHKTESLLFLSARSQLLNEKIIPALNSGKFVVCDRFTDSTLAYQGFGRGLNMGELEGLNSFVLGEECTNGHTFLLDVDVKDSLKRRNKIENDRKFHC